MRVGEDWIRAPKRVVGYHGCALNVGRAIIDGASPIPSNNQYDWLGRGVYFWEYGPERAAEWAHGRFPGEAAMLEAQIELGYCLNLLDSEHFDAIAVMFDALKEERVAGGVRLPENSNRGRNELDRMVVELYCSLVTRLGEPFRTVRGGFPEGQPLFPGSKILSRTHVQLSVRDLSCVSDWRLIQLSNPKSR